MKEVIVPYVPENYISGYQSYVCLFTGGKSIENISKQKIDELNIRRNEIMMNLEKRGVSVRQGTHAVHTLGYYKKKYHLSDEQYIKSYAADRLSIALPLYVTMTNEEFNYVIKMLRETISN